MMEILTVKVIDNDLGGHNDILFSIPELIDDKELDSYYFALALENVEDITDIEEAVIRLLNYWKNKVLESENGQTIYLPIDFSDQYTGCLRVMNRGSQLVLTYGTSMREAWRVNPLDPGDYYKDITDFEEDEKQMVVEKAIFLSTLDSQMKKLKD